MKKNVIKTILVFASIFMMFIAQNSVNASRPVKKCTDHLENWFCYEGVCMSGTDASWCDED
jgi:hypothetical protein